MLEPHGIVCMRAPNPGPFTLSGTNSWLIGAGPCWVVDPGPAIEAHVEALADEVVRRGGAGGIALTHDHGDHADAAGPLRELLGNVPVAAARPPAAIAAHARVVLRDGDVFGPLRAISVPGHADDHLAFVAGKAGFTGDAVLGEGSVFVASALAGYLEALERLRALDLAVLCPGHGPPVWDARAKLTEYLDHRRDRERRLLAALDAGLRSRDELLDAAWPDAPPALRDAAAVTLAAHLEKLRDEGRLPEGVGWSEGGGGRP
jgi:glyoxylase-like metal-dependent hydrolase (beta-lactamase superfamily II)